MGMACWHGSVTFVLVARSEDDLLQRLQSTFSAETKMKDDETHM